MTENKPETVKWMCALAYLLFFMPLLVVPTSDEGKYHANQGFTLLLAFVAINIVGSILKAIPIIGFVGALLLALGQTACLILAIIGIINALNQEQKPLPIIGEFTFLR